MLQNPRCLEKFLRPILTSRQRRNPELSAAEGACRSIPSPGHKGVLAEALGLPPEDGRCAAGALLRGRSAFRWFSVGTALLAQFG